MKRNFSIISKEVENNGSTVKHAFKREKPHVDGHWPSFLYISVFPMLGRTPRSVSSSIANQFSRLSCACTHHFNENWKTIFGVNVDNMQIIDSIALIREDEPHISLSKPFFLQAHQIDTFVENIEKSLKSVKRFAVDISSDYFLLMNDLNTRGFICLPLTNGVQGIIKVINAFDLELCKYGQPSYYKDPKCHVSLASFDVPAEFRTDAMKSKISEKVHSISSADIAKFNEIERDDCESDNENDLTSFTTVIIDSDDEEGLNVAITQQERFHKPKPIRIVVDKISCKIGNRMYTFNLEVI